jgi:hypothetical protein
VILPAQHYPTFQKLAVYCCWGGNWSGPLKLFPASHLPQYVSVVQTFALPDFSQVPAQ